MKKIIRREIPTADLPEVEHPLLQKIYAARGVKSASELDYKLNNLFSFTSLLGIGEAVKVLAAALQQEKSILVLGDFDVDGATSTTLAVTALKAFGASKVSYLIPNRFDYGYGLTPEIVNVAAAQKPDLILTVDNGISSVAGVARANELGIQVVITDHHLPPEELPAAAAIVNPHQAGDQFSSKMLAGVGVIFYVMLALRSFLRANNWFTAKQIPEPNMAQFLDLVALGTVADVVEFDYNNRILVAQGLERIQQGKCSAGIKALLAVANRSYDRVLASDLAFAVAPRINASGRLDDVSRGIECLLSNSVEHARRMAHELDALNNERREIEADMQQQAHRILDNLQLEQNLPHGLCVFEETWHQGVLGILASRLKDKLHRPVIAFAAINETEIKGSARSVAGIHMRDILSAIAARNPGLITRFGGHAMAAGLSLTREALPEFSEVFANEVGLYLDQNDLRGVIISDGKLEAEYFNLETAMLLRKSGPWGHGFAEPMFDGVFELSDQRIVGQKHLKLLLRVPGTEQEIDAIYFNIDSKLWPNHHCNLVRAVYRLDVNEYNGRRKLQLLVEYMERTIKN